MNGTEQTKSKVKAGLDSGKTKYSTMNLLRPLMQKERVGQRSKGLNDRG